MQQMNTSLINMYALFAHEWNNFQSSHFIQPFNFKEWQIKAVQITPLLFDLSLLKCKLVYHIHVFISLRICVNSLKKYLKLDNGIPTSGTILRVPARIDAKQLEKVFIEYAGKTFGKNIVENEILAIHGKTIRRSEYAPTIPDKKPYEAAYAVSTQVVFAGYVFRVYENR